MAQFWAKTSKRKQIVEILKPAETVMRIDDNSVTHYADDKYGGTQWKGKEKITVQNAEYHLFHSPRYFQIRLFKSVGKEYSMKRENGLEQTLFIDPSER